VNVGNLLIRKRALYISTIGPCKSAKQPRISGKEACVSAKEACVSAKEPDKSAKDPSTCVKKSHIYLPKRP